MQTVWYLAKLFISLGLGAVFALIAGKHRFQKATSGMLDTVLYGLLFFMGVNTAGIPDIKSQIVRIGLDAAVSTVMVIAGCLVSSTVLGWIFNRKTGHPERVRQTISWDRLKPPAVMIGIVVSGIVLPLSTGWFKWFDDGMITPLLYVLLFLVGMQMVQHEVDLIPLMKSPLVVLLPLSTVAGTYLGALIIPLATNFTLREAMTLVSGFGWYSLSGVLISDLGNPRLGSVSFLSNLFRESASFILIPLLATVSGSSCSAVSIAGATSMDVTLPLLKKSFGDPVVPLAIVHGVVMTLLVPFLIPLWYG